MADLERASLVILILVIVAFSVPITLEVVYRRRERKDGLR